MTYSAKFKYVVYLIILLISLPLAANDLAEEEANLTIEQLYHTPNSNMNLDMVTRIDEISAFFLGKPYILGSLGEGATALFDQFPQYRTDGFDCETYVTTVIALAFANELNDFKECLKKIRYFEGQVDYLTRNHFTGLDWNYNNQRQGFFKDITTSFRDKNNQSIAQIATAVIDKPAWYKFKSAETIRLKQKDNQEQAKRLEKLKQMGSRLPRSKEQVPYLPLTAFFNKKGEPNYNLFNQIPNGAIIEIVRPNWELNKKIGTNLNISHLGFAFRKDDQLIFRQASSEYGKVIDVSLINYLKEATKSPTIKGINVQTIIPSKPLNNGCNLSNK
nr:N-acetylmuramoyl-L-alanine amidase-like domain-containing protein [Legionella gresilensis]